MATDTKLVECFEACRTCGICFLASSNFLRQMFATAIDDPEMLLIRIELSQWNIEVNENDGFPQFVCISCIHEFQKLFKFRRSCMDVQQQFRHFYAQRQGNLKMHIKSEFPDPPEEEEENNCDFIYVDDLSDSEYDGGSITPFKIPHVPIKEELIEAAIPNENINDASATDKAERESFEATQLPEEAHEVVETAAPVTVIVSPLPEVPSNVHVTTTSKPILQPLPLAQEEVEKNLLVKSSGNIECKSCLHVSTGMVQHRLHMKRIHEIKDSECYICGKKFKNSTPTRLKFHLKWHKIGKHIKCVQCGFYCDSQSTLKEHVRAAHTKIECNICRKLIPSKRMKSHMRMHLNKTEWLCSSCNQVFNTENEREQHNRQTHILKDNAIQEEINSQNIVEQQHLPNSNTNFDESNETLINIFCEEKIEDQLYYRHDLETRIDSVDSNCNNTQTSFNDQEINTNSYGANLSNENMPIGTDETSDPERDGIVFPHIENIMIEVGHQFVCAQCTQTFASVEELCIHHKEHTIKSKFSCHICGKSFDLKFTLNRHLRKHKKAPF